METQEFKAKIEERINDEYNDVLTYMELSKSAENDGDKQILRDIAREEYIHAKHLEKIADVSGNEELVSSAESALEESWKRKMGINHLLTILEIVGYFL